MTTDNWKPTGEILQKAYTAFDLSRGSWFAAIKAVRPLIIAEALDEVRTILAGTDIGSLPNDMPLATIATKRMEEWYKFMWQVRDTCQRAEKAEKALAEVKPEIEAAERARIAKQLDSIGAHNLARDVRALKDSKP